MVRETRSTGPGGGSPSPAAGHHRRRGASSLLLALLFAVLALPIGLGLVLLVPPGEVADEPAHILKADSLLHGEWIGRRAPGPEPDGTVQPQEGVDADRSLLWALASIPRPLDTTPHRIDPAALAASRSAPFLDAPAFGEIDTIASYFPAFYLPAAAALALSHPLGFGARDAFLFARIADLLVAVALGTTALLLARRAHAILFATLLLPTALGLMASVNQDGLLIATASLATSWSTRISPASSPWRQRSFLGATLGIALICLAKPPYLPMAALLLLPAGTSWRRPLPSWPGMRLATIGLILLPVLGWTWANVHYAAAPIYRGPAAAGPLWKGPRPAIFTGTDMAAQLHVLLTKPVRLVSLPWHSLWSHPGIFRQVVDDMGWLNLLLPPWLVLFWTVALGVALFGGWRLPPCGTAAAPARCCSFPPCWCRSC